MIRNVLLLMSGFRSVPTSICYWHDVQSPDKPSLLFLGDEKGGIHLLRFLNPSKGLFKDSPKKELLRIFLPDLSHHGDVVSHHYVPNVHRQPINRVMFAPDTKVIMTSSESDRTSVVFTKVTLTGEPTVWSVEQGVKCFDYSAALQLMVTGGCDRAVRLWSPFVTTHPVAALWGHLTAVLDVAIYQRAGQIFSYSRDAVLKVWDLVSHACLKTIHLQFPCQQPSRIPEHGGVPFLLLSPPLSERPHLVVGCRDYLALLHLPETRSARAGGSSGGGGEGPGITCALCNSTLRQVVTGHADSSLSIWDVESGRTRIQILNAHGEEAVTSMALDSSHRRLITGSRSGTIKVWSLISGLNLHKLEPLTDSEVTGLTCLRDDKLLAVGWSQRIVQYDLSVKSKVLKIENAQQSLRIDLRSRIFTPESISSLIKLTVGSFQLGTLSVHASQQILNPIFPQTYYVSRAGCEDCCHSGLNYISKGDMYVGADVLWKSRSGHTGDISAVSQCSALGVVATASRDGGLIIWRCETQRPVLHLQGPTEKGAMPPIDGLLFLQHRAGDRRLRNGGVLVSSQAGSLCFWSVTGQTHTYGQFYAPEQPGERVLSLSSNQTENTLVVSGDTSGRLQIWSIADFGLVIQHQPVCEQPPLLQSWTVQREELVHVEVFNVADQLWVLTASASGSVSLWTKDGDHVGSFGQQELWSITEPATHQRLGLMV
ncbi:WD repeat-containing protein 49 [Takifugu flavidus]|uniref:WD repeat-containing protein 49 n=1 Tax=Takifugu flavidus TaxID=433684 RepID=A0A5C6PNQ3_9TELE|nr:WD repeat-containing protein 49 [Takifugu flavidus]